MPKNPPARVLVCGGRKFDDKDALFRQLDAWRPRIGVIICGAARGADALAADWARSRNVPLQLFPANWARHGRAAGFKRNWQMLKHGRPDVVIAFPGGKGTEQMVRIAREAGVKVIRIQPDARQSSLFD